MRPLLPSLCAALLAGVVACGAAPDGEQAPPFTAPAPDAGVAQNTSPAEDGPGLIIITTRELARRSQALPRFIEDKQRRGLRVLLATEDQYGSEGAVGVERALAIRRYLRGAADGYEYLLLIGDAHPELGDVPMLTVWPRHREPPGACGNAFAVDCRSCETDAFYADLEGEWDLDGDGRYGEHEEDDGPGGVSFVAELVVGRIPVYFGDWREADQILEHAMAYAAQTAAQAAYRRRALLPGAFSYFRGQRLLASVVPAHVDGADYTEWLARNVLAQHADVSIRRLYEREGAVVSRHEADAPLTAEEVIASWSAGYGMIAWAGHGMPGEVMRTVWREDADADGNADADELFAPPLLRAVDAPRIPAGRPGFAVATSCEVGSAEIPGNLSHALLLAGAAVGVVGSSSVTPASATEVSRSDAPLDETTFGSDSVAARVFAALLAGEPAAAGFTAAKQTLGAPEHVLSFAGKLMLNYFGDPTLRLTVEAPAAR